jgi:RHS repeat-associated protein
MAYSEGCKWQRDQIHPMGCRGDRPVAPTEIDMEYSEITDWGQIFQDFHPQGWYGYIKDQVGTIYKVWDHNAHQVADNRTYDSFGNLISQTGTTKTPLEFQGKYYDQESGLNYFYHRYYNPAVGRFISEDPITVKRGLNLFEFVRNNALNFKDPLGLYWEYCQATGRLYYNNITTGQRTFTGTGYSGCGVGLNNSSMQGVGDVGPIPQGYWTIGPMRNSIRTGPHVLDLIPKPETDLFGRDNSFQIHGNNTCDDQSASRGCIVLDRAIRDAIAQSCDDLLWVTE